MRRRGSRSPVPRRVRSRHGQRAGRSATPVTVSPFDTPSILRVWMETDSSSRPPHPQARVRLGRASLARPWTPDGATAGLAGC